MPRPLKLAVHIYELTGPLSEYCEKHGINASQATRIALARLLDCDVPKVNAGNPHFAPKERKHD